MRGKAAPDPEGRIQESIERVLILDGDLALFVNDRTPLVCVDPLVRHEEGAIGGCRLKEKTIEVAAICKSSLGLHRSPRSLLQLIIRGVWRRRNLSSKRKEKAKKRRKEKKEKGWK